MEQENNQEVQVEKQNVQTKGLESKNIKMFLVGLGSLIGAVLVISAGVGIYRVYAKTALDPFTVTVAKVLRLPALKVNGDRILYTEFAEDMNAINTMVNFEKSSGNDQASLTSEQMSDQVLWRLANNVLVKQAANSYGIKIEQSEIDQLKSNLMQQFKTTAELDAELQKRYGWDLNTYERKVISSFVLQSKLSEQISSDTAAREAIKTQANLVLEKIKAGADFAAMAKQYGEDGTNATGGDLGWFGKGDMVPEFEDAVFGLKKGELSPALVETQFGYHIVRLDDTKTETIPASKDNNWKAETKETVKASHILFKLPSAETYLDKQAKQGSIHLYLRVHNPFDELKQQ